MRSETEKGFGSAGLMSSSSMTAACCLLTRLPGMKRPSAAMSSEALDLPELEPVPEDAEQAGPSEDAAQEDGKMPQKPLAKKAAAKGKAKAKAKSKQASVPKPAPFKKPAARPGFSSVARNACSCLSATGRWGRTR